MELQITIVLLTAILAVAVTVWGAFTKRRSVAVAIVALAVAGLGGLLSYYACVETQSIPWAVGYGAVAIASAAVAARHLLGKKVRWA
jgi:Cu/Ag efflux pump CusA